jgi:hypothetical protein
MHAEDPAYISATNGTVHFLYYAECQLPPLQRMIEPLLEQHPAARVSFNSLLSSVIRKHVHRVEGQRSITDMFC